MRDVLNVEARRIRPWTMYPFSRSNSARYDPSWPVIPVISAVFASDTFRPAFCIYAAAIRLPPGG